jgi:hypothetical protein
MSTLRNSALLEWIHLDVVRRLTPSKDGNQEIHQTPSLGHFNIDTSTWTSR